MILERVGAKAFATSQWFEDVTFAYGDQDVFGSQSPIIEALYPPTYFPGVRPNRVGDNSKYVDSFGNRQKFGVGPWLYDLVDPETRTITTIREDSLDGIEKLTERFKWYLEGLSRGSSIMYERSRLLPDEQQQAGLLQIVDVAIAEVVHIDANTADLFDSDAKIATIFAKDASYDYRVEVPLADEQPFYCQFGPTRESTLYGLPASIKFLKGLQKSLKAIRSEVA